MEKEEKIVKINKNSLIKEKAGISYLQILILIISSFAFSYIVYEASKQINEVYDKEQVQKQENEGKNSLLVNFISNWLKRSKLNIVSAEELSWNCCPETNSGAFCQDLASTNCQEQCKETCLPTKCEKTSNCKLGCCFDNEEGLCTPNSPQEKCKNEEGVWEDNAACNILDCRLGCCVLGSNAQFVTEKRCKKLSAFYGFGDEVDFRQETDTELECLALAYSQAKGACVTEAENDIGEIEKGCKFLSQQECLQLTGNIANFYENALCSNPELNTICKKTQEKACVDGGDNAYFVDSCGNPDELAEECNFPEERCVEGKCKDLNCEKAPYVVDALGKILKKKDRVNGESWCVYDSYIGEGKDVVGSRHFKYYCSEGEVKIEPCSDYRQEVCVQSDVKDKGKTFSNAACRINRFRECLDYNSLTEKQGEKMNHKKMIEKCEENEECYVKKLDFGKEYKFSMCLPNYPPGFELESGRGSELANKICNMANFKCTKVEVKELFGWKCVAGCDCDSRTYTQQMNDWCISLGDCGGYVNILGSEDKGYSVSKAPKINLDKYQKYVNPVEGQKAEPGDTSDIMGEIFSGLYVREEITLEDAMGKLIGAKGVELAAISVISGISYIPGVGEAGGLSLSQSWSKIPVIGIKTPNFWAGFGNQFFGGLGGAFAGYYIGKAFGLEGDALKITTLAGGIAGAKTALAATTFAEGSAIAAGTTLATGSTLAAAGGGTTTYVAGQGGAKIILFAGEKAVEVGAGIPVTVAGDATIEVVGGELVAGPGAAAGAGGATAPAGAPLFGIDPVTLLIVIVITIIIMKLLGIGDTRETVAIFKCYPWEAPSGGDDCKECNKNPALKPCSKYRCESLGQACKLVNEGTGNELCVSAPGDSIAPVISPWQEILSFGYKYVNISENGFKLRQENSECIEAYKQIKFGIETNDVAQCKYDTDNKGYEEMENYFGDDNLYKENHSMPFTAPSLDAFASGFNLTYPYALDKIGTMMFHIKCKDVDGNVNIAPYLIDICIKPGPDLTAPIILRTNPVTGSYVAYNITNQDVTLYVNEPAECKYSLQDKNYEQMEKNMDCLIGLQQASLFGWTCSSTLDFTKNSTFYFRCKDQPWLPPENDTQRNANQQSFVYELKKSVSELKIIKIEPSGTIKAGVEPFSVTLKAFTSGGAESGKATCSFRFSEEGIWIWFKDTFADEHNQVFDSMFSGTHKIYVKCEDVAGNVASGSTNFKLEIDTKAPKVIRVYNLGNLKIITDEDAECVYSFKNCNFFWENATEMTGLLREHTTSWEEGKTYYVKCKDLWNNKADGCSIVVKAVS